MKIVTHFLSCLFAFFLLTGLATAQEKCHWATGDDLVIVHYPSVIAQSRIVRETSDSSEWKDFLQNTYSKLSASYKGIIEKSGMPEGMKNQVRLEAGRLIDRGPDGLRQSLVDAASHANALILALNFSPEDPKVSASLTMVLNTDPEHSEQIRQFVTEYVPHEILTNENGLLLMKFPTPKGDFFLGKTVMGTSSLTAVVLGSCRESVEVKINEYCDSSELADSVQANKNVLKSVYVNPRFVKEFVPKLDVFSQHAADQAKETAKSELQKIMPDYLKAVNIPEFFRNICRKFESVVYTVEENEDSGLGLTLQANAASEEDAQELNDLITGVLALIRIQIDQKGDSATTQEKETKSFLKKVQFQNEGTAVFVKVDLSAGMVTDFVKQALKNATQVSGN